LAPPLPLRLARKRSIKSGTIAAWRTDKGLKVVAVTLGKGITLRTVPRVGQVVSRQRRRTGILEYAAHEQALRGRPTRYRFRLFQQSYEVRLSPRRDRRGTIVGVRGTVRATVDVNGRAGPGPLQAPTHAALKLQIARKRRNRLQSALRSMELARAVAESARMSAEIVSRRAAEQQRKAEEAQVKAEEEERRARFLADASSILDSSFDQKQTMGRMARLLVLRMADWIVLDFRENHRLMRFLVHHRDPEAGKLLEEAYPTGEEPGFFRSGIFDDSRQGGKELFPSVTPEDQKGILQEGARRRAFRKLAVQSLIRTPVASHGRVIGLLTIGSSDPGRLYGLQDLQMARDLAGRIALARESSILYDEAQREIALRREAEARLRVFNVELERRVVERTAMLEEATREANSFAYTVAHDLRAPLRAISGFCHALQEDYVAAIDEVGQDYLSRIVAGARRMDDLIRDLLDYARLNRAEIRKGIVDLDEVVDGVKLTMAAELEERKAVLVVATPLGRVVGQAGVLAQALTNLLSNAVKFVAPGVTPRVEIRTESKGSRIRILIADNGIGVAPEHQERIFGIFERLNRAELYPGTGIGLAIVRRAVERLGGTVGLESQLGRGSTFWIELPSR